MPSWILKVFSSQECRRRTLRFHFVDRRGSHPRRAALVESSCVCLQFFALCSPARCFAQQSSAISGQVTDPTGGAIPNAQVTLTKSGQGTIFKATTNSAGEYSVPALEAGTYDLQVSAPGFEKFQATGIVLRVARAERVDTKLTVGAVTAEVSVSGSDLGAIQTSSPEISFTITAKQISQLVLNGRNFTQLVTLSPGVISQTGSDEGLTGVAGSIEYSMNGGRPEYNNWELDGASIMDNGSNSTLNVYPDIDAIAETEVLTSNYGAQYGRNASGTVQAQTKSGTEKFHGDVFEFLRNDAFNARNYFESSVPTYKKHDYGFTVGGPVFIPKLWDPAQKKTFFFYSQEWRHENIPDTVFSQIVPSTAERTGNFSDYCPDSTGSFANCPTIPGSGGAFYPNNQVPVDPNGTALLALIPAANSGSGTSSLYQASPSQLTTNREELFRIDQIVSEKLARLLSLHLRLLVHRQHAAPPSSTGSFPTVRKQLHRPRRRHGRQPHLRGHALARSTSSSPTTPPTTSPLSQHQPRASAATTSPPAMDSSHNGYGNVLPSDLLSPEERSLWRRLQSVSTQVTSPGRTPTQPTAIATTSPRRCRAAHAASSAPA